jgi:hypothetical protein
MSETESAAPTKRIVTAVPRPWEHGTVAVVEATVETAKLEAALQLPHVSNETEALLEMIKRAVTRWVNETDAGRAAWENSSEDFNVGDLSNEIGDKELTARLLEEGVVSLDIETHGTAHDWQYDRILVDENELTERDEEEEAAAV